jgi:hypothetical protein
LEDTLKKFMELVNQPTILVLHEPSLEDTLYAFRQTVNQPCQEIMDAHVANTEVVARLEGQFGHLVAEFNLMEEEEFQSHEMVHLTQESLEQHFPTAHVDDLEERANQLMAARHAVAPQILIVLFLIYLFDNIIQLISLRSLWYYGGW